MQQDSTPKKAQTWPVRMNMIRTISPSKGETVLRPCSESSEGQTSPAGFLNTHPIFKPSSICSTLKGRQAPLDPQVKSCMPTQLCLPHSSLANARCLRLSGRCVLAGGVCQALCIMHAHSAGQCPGFRHQHRPDKWSDVVHMHCQS